MLSRDEAVDVLTFAASYDGRKPNPAAVAAWVDASARGRWGFDEAVTAVKEHYARTTDWIMPGHVTVLVQAQRQLPPSVPEQRRALEGPKPASAEHIRAVMTEIAEVLGWGREIERRSVLAVACPWCRAHPGQPCTRRSRDSERVVPMNPHPARREAAELAQMEQEAGQ